MGRGGYWNYSPSVIQTGDVQQFWWCGAGKNPSDPSQISDTILYESINTATHVTSGPFIVLAETKGAWDGEYTCNPRVIGGTFVNPLGNGETYSYEMFYVGTQGTTPTISELHSPMTESNGRSIPTQLLCRCPRPPMAWDNPPPTTRMENRPSRSFTRTPRRWFIMSRRRLRMVFISRSRAPLPQMVSMPPTRTLSGPTWDSIRRPNTGMQRLICPRVRRARLEMSSNEGNMAFSSIASRTLLC